MEVTREEMLELAQYDTFQLDDRLNPLDRRELRSEAWLKGYNFARDHPQSDQKEMETQMEALRCENKDMREELTKRDEIIKALQQEPEPEQNAEFLDCGDIVEVRNAIDCTVAPIIALLYKTERNEQRKLQHHFITIDGNKFSRKADEVILEHASPDAIYREMKQHLQSLAQQD